MKANKPIVRFTCAALLAATTAAAHAEPIAASWQEREVRFHYSGFTSDYTCDGLRTQVKALLRKAGARQDVRVEGACGGDFSEPQPFHNVRLTFSVPVPAERGGADSPDGTFMAEWREVRIEPRRTNGVDWGDCELVEQFAEQVLPAFNPQRVADRVSCVPHQNTPGQPDLGMTLLVPVGPPAGAG